MMRHLVMIVSAFTLPGFAHVATGPRGGQVYQGRFPGTDRAGYVYLPPRFNPSRRYPVVYLLHGLPGSPGEYLHGLRLGQFGDEQIASGAIRPFIAVIPAAGTRGSYNGEWAGQWENALVTEVLPWVDAHLPTLAERSGRIIAGLSAGGYGAVDVALRHPRLFGTVESWSGYFAPLRDGPFVRANAQTLAAHDPFGLVRAEAPLLRREATRFFISTGPRHSNQIDPVSSVTFADELAVLRLRVTYRSYPTEVGQWRDQVDAGLHWALGASS